MHTPTLPHARKPGRSRQFRWRGTAAARFLVGITLAVAAASAHATPYTGTFPGGSTTTFTAAGLPSTGSTTADTLTFTTSGSGTAVGTDDIIAALNANILTFSNSAALALNQGAGTTIGLGGATPVVNLSNTALVTDNLNLSLAANTTFNGSGSLTMGGAVSGAGFTLTKNGTGTLTFSGSGTSTLTELIPNSGTTNFGDAGNAPTLNVGASGSVAVFVGSTGGTSTFNMVNGTLTATASQGLVLSGNQTYAQTGGTFTTNGRIEFANNGGSSTVNVSAGTLSTTASSGIETVRGATTITLSGTGTITTPLLDMTTTQLSGGAASSTFNLNGGTLVAGQIIPGSNGTTGTGTNFNFNGGTLQSSASSTTFMQGLTNAFVKSGGAIVNTNGFNDTIGQNLLTDAVSTGGGLTKLGTGTLTLSGTNTYTGTTTVSAGTLKASSTSAFGSNSAVTLANVAGATLDITGFNNAIGSLTGGGTTGGNVTLGAAALTVGSDNTSPAAYAGTISGTGGGLTKLGTGTLTLSGTNTYTGATAVNGGILKAGVITNAFGSNSAVTLANVAGATLDITGFNNAIGSLTGGGTTGGNVTLGAAALTVGGDNTSPAAYAGTFSGTGTLAKVGTGTMIIGGSGTSTAGQITVNNAVNSAGGLSFGSATESPTLTLSGSGVTINSNGSTATAPTFTMAGGTLGLGSSNGAFTMNTGTYTQTGGAVTESGAGISYLANAGSTQTSTFNLSGGSFTAGSGNFYGAVRGTSTINVSGTGVLTAPLFTMVYGGSGVSNAANSTVNLGNGAAGGTLVVNAVSNNVNGASTGTSTFNFNGGTLKASASTTTFMQGLTNAFVKSGGAIVNTNGFNDTIGQNLLTDAVSTGGGLTKLGTGTLTLTGANTYTGTTTVSAGTLALNTAGTTAAQTTGAVTGSNVTISGDGTVGTIAASGTNGVLSLSASNQIGNSTNVTLAGGTLALNGKSEGTTSGSSATGQAGVTATAAGAGQLSVTTDSGVSYLDFGLNNTGAVFTFASYDFANLGDLYIINYNDGNFTGTYTPGTGGGPDQLFFGANNQYAAQQLQHVFFVDPKGAGGTTQTGLWQARLLSTGEVVAPEPSQWVALLVGALGLGGLALKARRRSAALAA